LDSGWVDLEAGVIHFIGKAEAETRKRRGVVRMPNTLHEEMKTWGQDGSHVISFKDSPVSRIDKAFRAAVKRADLADVTPHTLKHTAVTWAFMRGLTLEDATAYFATSRETWKVSIAPTVRTHSEPLSAPWIGNSDEVR